MSEKLSGVRIDHLKKAAFVGLVAGVPLAAGAAQEQSPSEIVVYGALNWLTAGSERPLDPEFMREFHDNLMTADPELPEDLGRISDSITSAHVSTVLNLGLLGGGAVLFGMRRRHNEQKRQRIAEGREPLRPQGEQFFVLAGRGNNIVDELVKGKLSANFVPIFETSDGANDLPAIRESRNSVYLNLGVADHKGGLSYLNTDAWDLLNLSPANMINSENGRRYLMVVGIGMERGSELSWRQENVGVTQDNLRSAAVRIFQGLPEGTLFSSPDPDTGEDDKGQRDIVDVYVANHGIEHEDFLTEDEGEIDEEGRKWISDRELAKLTGVDVYIDSMSVAMKAVYDELTKRNLFSFNLGTTSKHYRERFRNLFSDFSQSQGNRIEIETDSNKNTGTYLVYEGSNEKTYHAVRRLKRRLREQNQKAEIIALVTADLTKQAERGALKGVTLINTSEIIARIIEDVAKSIKGGIMPQQIQDAIDTFTLPLPPQQ